MEQMQLPEAFVEKMQRLLKDEWDQFLLSYQNENYQALRFNPLKKGMTEEKYAIIFGRLVEDGSGEKRPGEFARVPWAADAFYYDNSIRPGKHAYHEAGLYYIQEPSAMSAAAMLAPRRGMRVLDLCAAPGGKTTQLASYLDQKGLLVANEIHPARCRILSQNVERMGICNAIVTNEESKRLAEHFPLYFHAILVDAPCSGEGMFRKNPEAMEEWSKKQVQSCALRQQEILSNAAEMLMAGGTLVYSTCTFSPEENEQTIARFLAEHEEFEVMEQKAPWFMPGRPEWALPRLIEAGNPGPEQNLARTEAKTESESEDLKKTLRLWPHHLRGEGHFVAVLRKKGTSPEERMPLLSRNEEEKKQSRKNTGGGKGSGDRRGGLDGDKQRALLEFTEASLSKETADWILAGELILFGDQLYRLPENAPSLKGLKVLRAGLHIGEFKKNRFEPSHALALALGMQDVRCAVDLELKDTRTNAFFMGESLQIRESDLAPNTLGQKGWALLCVDGFSAGWGKLTGNQFKNHYPKGLRRTL